MLSMLFVSAALVISQPVLLGFSLKPCPYLDCCITTDNDLRNRTGISVQAVDQSQPGMSMASGSYLRKFKTLTASDLPVARSLVQLSAPQRRNGIGGYIFDTSRRPIANLRTELLDEVDSIISITRTDSSGRYSFHSLSQGTYQVRVLTDGTNFIGQTTRVTISGFTRRTSGGGGLTTGIQFEQVDFALKSKYEAKASSKPMSTGLTFAQDVPDSARTAYEQAIEKLERKNDAEQGMAGLKKAIGLFPSYYLALERLGAEYLKRKEYEPAAAALYKAVEVNPKGPSSFYALGVAQYYLKQVSEAIKSLRHSMSLAPDSPNAAFLQMYLGMALIKGGKTDEAETHLRQAHERTGPGRSHASGADIQQLQALQRGRRRVGAFLGGGAGRPRRGSDQERY
jgi:TolA-binding protein